MTSNYPAHHDIKTGHIFRCQICNFDKLKLVLDLGHQPLCDTLVAKEQLDEPEKTYPLRMVWCPKCTCAQIDYCVDGNEVYHPDYPYRSGITKELSEYQVNICLSLISKYKLTPHDLAVDIGSNDGTLLSGFKREGIPVLGVEPTNIAKLAIKNGIPTIQTFFDRKAAREIRKKYGPAKAITATNMFAHMQTLGEVICGIHHLLTDDGVFVSETHYLLDVLQGGQFDTIYHEHLRTYSLKSLVKLFSYYEFTVTDVERGSRYGGNLRVHVSKGKGKKVSEAVTTLLRLEHDSGLGEFDSYSKFAARVKKARSKFMKFLLQTNIDHQSIVANSCPGRASTLLNYYGVDRDYVPYIAEQPTSLKLGMYLPGKHIPVVNNKVLLKEQPRYVILLAWHYAQPIMAQLKKRGLRSDFIIPLPDFKIVKNSEVKQV